MVFWLTSFETYAECYLVIFELMLFQLFQLEFIQRFLMICGDIHLKLGPKCHLSICFWNSTMSVRIDF